MKYSAANCKYIDNDKRIAVLEKTEFEGAGTESSRKRLDIALAIRSELERRAKLNLWDYGPAGADIDPDESDHEQWTLSERVPSVEKDKQPFLLSGSSVVKNSKEVPPQSVGVRNESEPNVCTDKRRAKVTAANEPTIPSCLSCSKGNLPCLAQIKLGRTLKSCYPCRIESRRCRFPVEDDTSTQCDDRRDDKRGPADRTAHKEAADTEESSQVDRPFSALPSTGDKRSASPSPKRRSKRNKVQQKAEDGIDENDGVQDDVFRLCTKKNVEVEDYILRECFKVRESLITAKRHNDSIVESVLSHVVMTDTPVDVMCEEWEARVDFKTWVNKWRKYNASEKDETHSASSALPSTDDQQMSEVGIEAIEATLADGQSVGIQDGDSESCSKKVEVDEWILRECFKVRGNLKAAEQQNDRIVVSILSSVVLTMTDKIMVDDMGEEWEDTFEAWVKKWREFAHENEVIPNK